MWIATAMPHVMGGNTIMRKIPAMLRDKTLGDKKIINGLTVMKRLITKQDAVTHFGSRMRDHMSDPDTKLYILVRIFLDVNCKNKCNESSTKP